MKVIIHYQENIGNTVHFTVSSLASIKALIGTFSHEDIEGEIRPSARNNPEFFAILKAIYDHKVDLWNSLAGVHPPGPPFHEKFANIIYDKYRIVLMP